MNQIVYQPQDQNDRKTNNFKLTTDQVKHLNALMPVGYNIISRNKSLALPNKKKETPAPVFVQQKNKKQNEDYSDDELRITLPLPPQKILSPEMTRCMKILDSLKKHPAAAVFLDPVDTSIITDYLDYVNEPIDLGIIQYNVQNGVYQTFTQFMDDIKKMWYNAYSYNPKDTPIYLITVQMDKYFDKLLKDDNIPIPTLEVLPPPPIREIITQPRPEPRKKVSTTNFISDIPLTMQQKRNIVSLIKKLPNQYLKGVWDIVSNPNHQEDNLEFDIETLPVRKARQLEQHVKKSFAEIDAKNKHNPTFDVLVDNIEDKGKRELSFRELIVFYY